jgi:hypothetical protein
VGEGEKIAKRERREGRWRRGRKEGIRVNVRRGRREEEEGK